MNPAPSAFKPFEKPIEVLFVLGNGLVWLTFCIALILRWNLLPGSSRWSGVVLAISFLSLGHSLLKGNDRSSNLMYCTMAFLATMLTGSRVL